MKTLFVRQYDAFGDWISVNGLIRYLIEERSYEKVYVVLEYNPTRKNFVEHLFNDDSRISTIMNYEMDDVCTIKDDVIDTRYNEFNNPCISLHYWSNQNKYGNYIHSGDESNSIKFYSELGIDPIIKNEKFFFSRNYEMENILFDSLNLIKPYSVVCEYDENLIDRKYVKYSNVVNLHNISPNIVDILKIIENSDDVHLIENTISLFVYHMQYKNLMNLNKINLHTYSRKESSRICNNTFDNPYLRMLLLPKLNNWEFIY